MALRLNCLAIISSCDESSSWSAVVVVVLWFPPSLRFVGVGPKLREYEEASAVSEGLEGRSEGNADVIRVGDISSGSGGLMNKPWVVETFGGGEGEDGSGGGAGSRVSCCGGLEDTGMGRVGKIGGGI